MNKNTTGVVMLAVGFAVGFAIAWNIPHGEKEATSPVADEQEVQGDTDLSDAVTVTGGNETMINVDNGENAIVVADQPAGSTVTLSKVLLADVGWVAIHDVNNGKPGNILGAARFQPGTSSGVVELLRPTVDGKPYLAMLHRENGDGTFDHTKDLPLTGADGKRIETLFVATTPGGAQ